MKKSGEKIVYSRFLKFLKRRLRDNEEKKITDRVVGMVKKKIRAAAARELQKRLTSSSHGAP